MADYSQYQGPNPEWEALTRTTVLPPVGLGPGETPESYQASRNALREAISRKELETEGEFLHASLLNQVCWETHQIPTRDNSTIPVRIYKPKDTSASTPPLPVYFFLHGGGYLFGSLDTEDANCSRVIASSPSPLMVVHANYRHTPQFKYPTPHNDAWDAFLWLGRNIASLGGDRQQVIVGGISAGAGLAASVVLRAQQPAESGSAVHHDMHIVGQLLMIPWLIPTRNYPLDLIVSKDRSSYVQNIQAPILPETQMKMFIDLLDAPVSEPVDVYLCPSLAPDQTLGCTPKTVVVVAGMDPLRDEALLYADRLETNRVPTKVHVFPGLPHGFRRFNGLDASARWDELVTEGLHWCMSDSRTSTRTTESPRAGVKMG
ncbi:hypothetical protein FE257_006913 [Aspergillus nanangensis]|uniref:Alpha/beta hydrolase fold-3 domain-containing protein n=1 Tax=Aspergillus nanangensis TaxID=2582783 RepID=A0AAD4CP48_ASPNN|nr:hypothetical protein FE257_006913 [Aspergillus nanangensis]